MAVWSISKKFNVYPAFPAEIGGGRGGGETDAELQRLLELVFEV